MTSKICNTYSNTSIETCSSNYLIIIILDSVYNRNQKPRCGIQFILNLSRYQHDIGNERINTKTNKFKEYKYFAILFCSFVFCLIKIQYNKIKSISKYREIIMYITIK